MSISFTFFIFLHGGRAFLLRFLSSAVAEGHSFLILLFSAMVDERFFSILLSSAASDDRSFKSDEGMLGISEEFYYFCVTNDEWNGKRRIEISLYGHT